MLTSRASRALGGGKILATALYLMTLLPPFLPASVSPELAISEECAFSSLELASSRKKWQDPKVRPVKHELPSWPWSWLLFFPAPHAPSSQHCQKLPVWLPPSVCLFIPQAPSLRLCTGTFEDFHCSQSGCISHLTLPTSSIYNPVFVLGSHPSEFRELCAQSHSWQIQRTL